MCLCEAMILLSQGGGGGAVSSINKKSNLLTNVINASEKFTQSLICNDCNSFYWQVDLLRYSSL